MKRLLAATGFAICGLLFFARADAQMPIEKESHHKIAFENQNMRVFDLIIPHGDTTLLHSHSAASAVIFLSASDLVIQDPGQAPVTTPVTPGVTIYRAYDEKPVVHRVWCNDKNMFRCLVVEMKPHIPHSGCEPLPGSKSLWSQKLLNAYQIDFTYGPAYKISKSDCSMLLINISGNVAVNLAGKIHTLMPGEFRLISPASDNEVRETGDRPAKCILLQLK